MSGLKRYVGTTAFAALAALAIGGSVVAAQSAMTMPAASVPTVGSTAPEFSLPSLSGTTVTLADQLRRGPVVLVVLRGWPGYQCPFCTRQFGEYLSQADALKSRGSRVVFVYPGPADGLSGHAAAFTADKPLPDHFVFLTDPEFTFTNRYGLRWNAPQETAYPSTFVLDGSGRIVFAHVSHEHGDRVAAATVLDALDSLKP